MHPDKAVAPVWENAVEPPLGTMVHADRDTLVCRRHVHQIPLDSEGTVRPERIGTEVFARPTNTYARAESTPAGSASRR